MKLRKQARRVGYVGGAVLLLMPLAILLTGCPQSRDATTTNDAGDSAQTLPFVFYETDIQPIFDAHCAFCHTAAGVDAGGAPVVADGNGGSGNQSGRITLDLTRGASFNSLTGRPSQEDPDYSLIQPGVPELSWLYLKIAREVPLVGQHMPPYGRLSDSDLALIRRWIVLGALRD